MIDRATVDRVLEAAKIYDVVSDYVSLKRRGANYVGLCPFHNDRTPSFYVSPAKNICKCFVCGGGGNPLSFLKAIGPMDFPEAIRYLAKKYGIEIVEKELTEEERRKETKREGMFHINEYAAKLFENNLYNTEEGENVGLAYFRERGFRAETIKKFHLGYALEGRDALWRQAGADGEHQEYLIDTGLCTRTERGDIFDRYRGRVIFPIYNRAGKVVGFGGRILKKSDKLAKYVNSPESEIYHKRKELYGLFQSRSAIAKKGRCYLVEGYTDVISMHQAGIENVVASSGTALTVQQIGLIRNLTNNITVLYDGDEAGIKAALRGIDMLLYDGLSVKVLLLPDGHDPDSFARSMSSSEFEAYIDTHQTDFIVFKTKLLMEEAKGDPMKRVEMINSILHSIAHINDPIATAVYIKETSRMVDMPEDALAQKVAELRPKVREQAEMQRKQEMEAGQGVSESATGESPKPTPQPTTGQTYQPRTGPTFEPPVMLPPEMGGGFADPIAPPTTTPPTPPTPPTPAKEERRSLPTDRFERTLISYIVLYGDTKLGPDYVDEEGTVCSYPTVIEFIRQRLKDEDIHFRHPLYATLFDLTKSVPEGRSFEQYFINYPEEPISKLAVDISSEAERYQLSKIHSKFQTITEDKDRLLDLVPRAIFELQDAILSEEINRVNNTIRNNANVMTEVARAMERLTELYQIRAELAKALGERIILKK